MRRVIPRFFKFSGVFGHSRACLLSGIRPTCGRKLYFVPQLFRVIGFIGSLLLCQTGRAPMACDGAFSGAALASQSLSELSQTTTETTTKEIGKSIVERREQERERCPAGFSRVDGACQPTRRPVREPARAVPREKPTPAAVVKAPPPLPIEPAVRFGTWTQVYGDYQKRDAAGPGVLNCCIGGPLAEFSLSSRLTLKAGRARLVLWPALISLPGAFFLQTMVSSQG